MKTPISILIAILIAIPSLGQTNFIRDPMNPVLTGVSTTITNICDPSVLFDNGMFRMWAGCIESDVNYASICYSESSDGTSWTTPIIVFTPSNLSGAWDNTKTEIPTVIKDSTETEPLKRYKMWYGGADSLAPNVVDSMGYAYSPDGINWTRLPAAQSPFGQDGLVFEPGIINGDAGVVSDPTALKVGSTYHIWYNSFGGGDSLYISHATSPDGINWSRDPANPVLSPTEIWEGQGTGTISADVSHPTVMWDGFQYKMWYGSFDSTIFVRYDGLGYATSPDGTIWTKDAANPIFTPDLNKPGEQIGISSGPNVLLVGSTYQLFYCAINDTAIRNILHASGPALGINDQISENKIAIYPNPLVESAEIIFENPNKRPHTLTIYNMQGRRVRILSDITSERVEIERKELTAGWYLFELRSMDQVKASGKLAIK
jgi:predicted GH43/DUF377 family glycosyl hydrolase